MRSTRQITELKDLIASNPAVRGSPNATAGVHGLYRCDDSGVAASGACTRASDEGIGGSGFCSQRVRPW